MKFQTGTKSAELTRRSLADSCGEPLRPSRAYLQRARISNGVAHQQQSAFAVGTCAAKRSHHACGAILLMTLSDPSGSITKGAERAGSANTNSNNANWLESATPIHVTSGGSGIERLGQIALSWSRQVWRYPKTSSESPAKFDFLQTTSKGDFSRRGQRSTTWGVAINLLRDQPLHDQARTVLKVNHRTCPVRRGGDCRGPRATHQRRPRGGNYCLVDFDVSD